MKLSPAQWTLGHLREHLQAAVDLEFWTIPFYLTAMYSIVDRTSTAFQLVQSIVNQEMLHTQLVANVANAYGLSPAFAAPVYEGKAIPHLDFALDTPDPRDTYQPFSAELGPLDTARVNAMCLIEYPEYDTGHIPDLRDTVTEYGSIGEFYDALVYGARLLADDLRGGVNQVDHFAAYYRDLPATTVSESGLEGWRQADLLLAVIRDQGEGADVAGGPILPPFENTADDSQPAAAHYDKFLEIRDAALPEVYRTTHPGDYDADQQQVQQILRRAFVQLRHCLVEVFAGRNPAPFLPLMVSVGAAIGNCWQHGVTPDLDPSD